LLARFVSRTFNLPQTKMPIPPSSRIAAARLLSRNTSFIGAASRTVRPHAVNLTRQPFTRHFSSSGTPPSGESMNLRKTYLALISGIVLGASWYYRDTLLAQSPAPTSTSASPEGGKQILAVDHADIYTGTLPPSVSVTKEASTEDQRVVEMLSPEEATKKLRRNEESYLINRGRGVFRYDVVQVPSNDPIEDDHAEKIIEIPGGVSGTSSPSDDWMFWGVFDGHSGWTTSAKLRQTLIAFVARELHHTYKAALTSATPSAPESSKIDEAIKRAFVKLDNEIVHESVDKLFKNPSKPVAAELLAPALSGSCALLAFFDSRSKQLKVAVTGDSRAVLGRRGANGRWTATQLSEDQTGSNPNEVTRMRAEHPGEEHVIRNGRVLGGLEPTRAFGDATYKWSLDVQKRIKESFFGRTPSIHMKTPPYVTAEPVVTTAEIMPEKGDFVVMATDGLWEMLTNEEVVGLVGRWIEEQKEGNSNKGWFGGSWFKGKKSDLPVEKGQEDPSKLPPIRTRQWGIDHNQNGRFVCEDKNAATHVVRNALGGKDSNMLCALLTLPSPYSRRYR
jgi:pyruvate dehydrogenase phosphatase